MKIRAKITCEMMPNQAEGTVNGVCFYYRARWGSYSLRIGDTPAAAVLGKLVDCGDSPQGGWWENKTTLRKMRRSIYRAAKRGLLTRAALTCSDTPG